MLKIDHIFNDAFYIFNETNNKCNELYKYNKSRTSNKINTKIAMVLKAASKKVFHEMTDAAG